VREAIAELGLADIADMPLNALSGGSASAYLAQALAPGRTPSPRRARGQSGRTARATTRRLFDEAYPAARRRSSPPMTSKRPRLATTLCSSPPACRLRSLGRSAADGGSARYLRPSRQGRGDKLVVLGREHGHDATNRRNKAYEGSSSRQSGIRVSAIGLGCMGSRILRPSNDVASVTS